MGRAGQGCIDHSLAVAFLSGRPRLGLQNIGLNKGRSERSLETVCFIRLAWPAFHKFMEASTIE